MRVRQMLAFALAALALLMAAGCANGSGLRVEESDPGEAGPSLAAPSPTVSTTGRDQRAIPAVTVSLAEVRRRLLADRALEPFFRTVLTKCTVMERCMTRGATVNVTKAAHPQLVVLIHTVDNFAYGAVLMAVEPAGPRRVWGLRAEQPKISASQQGDLVVESGVFADDDPVCCPSVTRVEVWRWTGQQMSKVSSQDQKGD